MKKLLVRSRNGQINPPSHLWSLYLTLPSPQKLIRMSSRMLTNFFHQVFFAYFLAVYLILQDLRQTCRRKTFHNSRHSAFSINNNICTSTSTNVLHHI